MTPVPVESEPLIDTKAAAAFLGISPITLGIWRCDPDKDQPAYIRCGAKSVRYAPAELRRWVASLEQRPGCRRRRRKSAK